MSDFAAYIGIDWADKKHDICLVEAATGHKESRVLKHTPEVSDEWAGSLATCFPGQRLAVCLEQSRGPLIFALLKYDFLTLYPITPATLAHYREAFAPSCAKSARPDLLAQRLLTIKHGLPLTTDPAVINSSVVKLQALVAEMQSILQALAALEAEIETLCQTHPDYPIFASLPGSGSIYAARLLAALGTQRDRFGSALELASLSGIAPVIERSGLST